MGHVSHTTRSLIVTMPRARRKGARKSNRRGDVTVHSAPATGNQLYIDRFPASQLGDNKL